MTIRTILTPVRGDGKGEGVLDHALVIAKRFDAHLDVLHARPKPTDMLPYGVLMTDAMRKAVIEAAERQSGTEEDRVRKLFQDYCEARGLKVVQSMAEAGGGVTISWRELTGKQADLIGLWGRLSDVIAVAQPDSDKNLGYNTLEAALLQTGRPVLMCPPKPVDKVGEHVAIAWNGSVEAASAVSAALPLLGKAERAIVLATGEDGETGQLTAQHLIDYLGLHGIKCDLHIFKPKASIGVSLLSAAKAANADTLLMGGYGHSRRRELIMGGATREVIDRADIPVLMQH